MEGFESINQPYDFYTFSRHRFGYGGQSRSFWLGRILMDFNSYREANDKARLIPRLFLSILGRFFHLAYFLISIFRYDSFIFTYGTSFLKDNKDIPILRFFGKTIIMNMAHGSELRPPYIDGSYQSSDGVEKPALQHLVYLAQNYSQRMSFLERHCTYIIGAPFSSSQFAKRPFINSFALGVPCSTEGALSTKCKDDKLISDSNSNKVRIVHSPSHEKLKGTRIIRDSITELKQKGYQIEYIELQGRSNKEVLEELKVCDFVVDQIYSDSPMASFASEAASFGKPAIVGGFGLEQLKNHIPEGMYPPSYICLPDGITEAIEKLISDVEFRQELGSAAKSFVKKEWSVENVAKRFQSLISNQIQNDWWLNPDTISYVHGIGQDSFETKTIIAEIIAKFGTEALQVGHRKALEAKFVAFSENELC